MPKKDYYIDLHVHTYGSLDWRGDKDGKCFIRILKDAKENDIDLIALTDHNSLKGYKEYIKQKEEIFQVMTIIKRRDDFSQEYIRKLEEEFNLFNSIKVLMGIELKADPGIHYIIVFDESISSQDVESLLDEHTQGEFKNNIGNEEYTLPLTSENLFKIFKDKFNDNCLIYAPHADSNSGLMKVLKESKQKRLELLCNSRLSAVGINSNDTKDYIQSNLIPNFPKPREYPLKFVNDSDYHGKTGEKVGSGFIILGKNSYELSFSDLSRCIHSRLEIRTFLDIAKERYEKFIQDERNILRMSVDLDKDKEDHLDDLCKGVCAFLNTDDGIIEFEMDNLDAQEPSTKINKKTDDYIRILGEKINFTPEKGDVYGFPTSKGKYKVLFKFTKSKKLVLYNNICYCLRNGKVEIASSDEVEAIVAKKIYYRFGKVKDAAINNIAHESYRIKSQLLSFSIAYKTESQLYDLKQLNYELLEISFLTEDEFKSIDHEGNGEPKGSTVVISRDMPRDLVASRLKSSYYRVSAPMFSTPLENKENRKVYDCKANDILVFNNGGCCLILEDSKVLTETFSILIPSSSYKVKPYALIGYLKSSFFIWYISKVLHYKHTFDFFFNNISHELKFPSFLMSNDDICSSVNNIIVEEKKFLSAIRNAKKKEKKSEELLHLTDSHNTSCDKLITSIDKLIFNNLKLNRDEIKFIYDGLKEMNIHDCGALNNFEQIFN